MTLFLTALLVLAVGPLAGPPGESLETALREARAAIEQGRPRAAIERLEALPPGREVSVLLGVAHYHADEYPKAIELLTRALEALPLLEQTRAWAGGAPELNQALGRAYIQTRQPEKARAAWARTFGLSED